MLFNFFFNQHADSLSAFDCLQQRQAADIAKSQRIDQHPGDEAPALTGWRRGARQAARTLQGQFPPKTEDPVPASSGFAPNAHQPARVRILVCAGKPPVFLKNKPVIAGAGCCSLPDRSRAGPCLG